MSQTYTLPVTTDKHSKTVDKKNKTIVLTPLEITKYLFSFVSLLVIINLTLFYLESRLINQLELIKVFERYFDFDTEFNIPTLFSSFILLAAGAISFFIYNLELDTPSRNNYKKSWLLISFIFIFLCLDESCQLHEKLGKYVKIFASSEILDHLPIKWVVPYVLIFAIVAVFLLRFLIALPKKTRILFVISGFIFLLGAVILEEVGGYFWALHGKEHFYYKISYTIEETLEMSGIIIFIYTLLDYIALSHPRIHIATRNDWQKYE